MFPLERAKILIVDDLEETRFMARTILRRNGNYEFFEAENGKEGIEIAQRERPHLILMDALMPVMDGFEAISHLRSDPNTERIPILMISALNTQDEKIRALTSGISDFIAKPFDKTELLIRVNSLLSLYLNFLQKEEELGALNLQLERKVADRTRELRDKTGYTQAVLDSTPSLIAVFDRSGMIVDTNQAWRDFFAPLKCAGEGRSNLSFLIPHVPRFEDTHFLNAYDTGEWFSMLLGNREHGYKLQISMEPECHLFNVSARNVQYAHDDTDVSQRLEERFIVTLNDITELERIREEREGQIKLASIGKLAAGITHEINTPLTYIKGNVELMRLDLDDIDDSPAKSGLRESMKSIEEGLRRIGNIIDATREITKKGSGEKEKTNLYETLVYASRMVYNRTKHLAPIYLDGELLNLDTDATQKVFETLGLREKLEQVWIVILNNAADEFLTSHVPFEERWIRVDVSGTEREIVIRFADNARAISEKILPHIFEPFISSKTHSGMGIGLNIARSILQEHGGTISAHNDGETAVFTVVLPVYRFAKSDASSRSTVDKAEG